MSDSFQGLWSRSIAFRMVKSLRMQATKATFSACRHERGAGRRHEWPHCSVWPSPSPVQGRAYRGAPAPNTAFAAQGAAVAIKRTHAHQGTDAVAVQRPEFRQTGHQGPGVDRANAGDAFQEVLLLPPHGTPRMRWPNSRSLPASRRCSHSTVVFRSRFTRVCRARARRFRSAVNISRS